MLVCPRTYQKEQQSSVLLVARHGCLPHRNCVPVPPCGDPPGPAFCSRCFVVGSMISEVRFQLEVFSHYVVMRHPQGSTLPLWFVPYIDSSCLPTVVATHLLQLHNATGFALKHYPERAPHSPGFGIETYKLS